MLYKINTPNIAHETIDNEVIVINFEQGSYYSLSGSAALAWSFFEHGATCDAVAAALAQYYGLDSGSDSGSESGGSALQETIAPFVDQLIAEELIVEVAQNCAPAPAVGKLPASAGEYAPPVLQRFTDMQELLLLDPIHEVNETAGWPLPRQ